MREVDDKGERLYSDSDDDIAGVDPDGYGDEEEGEEESEDEEDGRTHIKKTQKSYAGSS